MNLRKSIISTVFAASVALSGAVALAQDATPNADATPVTYLTVQPQKLKTADGKFAGTVTLWEDADGTHMAVKSASGEILAEGEYGVHLHETGICDADSGFESAGGHFNPTDEAHGDANADPSHAGDLGNMTVEEDGSFDFWATAEKVTLNPDVDNSLNDADGTAIIIHAGADDLSTDPSGESGDRAICGVIFAPIEVEATPGATPRS